MATEAARSIAEKLRAAMKSQNLSGRELAVAIERLTGRRPTENQVSRLLWSRKQLIRVDPMLFVLAEVLDLDAAQLVHDAVFPQPVPEVKP